MNRRIATLLFDALDVPGAARFDASPYLVGHLCGEAVPYRAAAHRERDRHRRQPE